MSAEQILTPDQIEQKWGAYFQTTREATKEDFIQLVRDIAVNGKVEFISSKYDMSVEYDSKNHIASFELSKDEDKEYFIFVWEREPKDALTSFGTYGMREESVFLDLGRMPRTETRGLYVTLNPEQILKLEKRIWNAYKVNTHWEEMDKFFGG